MKSVVYSDQGGYLASIAASEPWALIAAYTSFPTCVFFGGATLIQQSDDDGRY
jgi:hypothetical protein